MGSLTVTIGVIAYNEERFIQRLLNDLKDQTYPLKLIELILVDGNSKDTTKRIMLKFEKEYQQLFRAIKVLDNPKRVQPAGWNIVLLHSTGDIIVRIDAHTHIPNEFISRNVKNIENGEFVSGGQRPCLIEDDSKWSRALLLTENSMFGSSISKSRSGKKKEYVKSFFHAAYSRRVFADAGGFNENLLRTEDNELHYRIRKAGYKFCYDPKITSYQFARSNLKRMIKQKYGNGYWIGLTLGVCPGCISVYHLIPMLFVLGVITTTILATVGIWQLSATMWLLYLIFGVTSTVLAAVKEKDNNPYIILMPILFLILHIAYGIGTLIGVFQMPFRKKKLQECARIQEVQDYFKHTYINS